MRDASPTPPVASIRIRFTRAAAVWVVVAVVLTVVGWYKTINLLVLAGYLLIALLGVNLWLAWRMAARLIATRQPTSPAFCGETIAIATEVRNDSGRAVTTLLTDQADSNRAAWLFAPLPAGESRLLTARWSFKTRGRHTIGPLMVDSSYPIGLVHVLHSLSADSHILVLPPIGKVDLEMFRRWLIRGGAGDGQTRRPSRRAALGNGDIRGLRPYRPGDSPREIHWRSSARRSQLLVREYDCSEPLDLIIVVDPWLPERNKAWDEDSTANTEAARRLEWALSLATSLALAWGNTDNPADLTLIVPGSPVIVQHGPGSQGFVRKAFACLAEVRGTDRVPVVSPDYARRRSNRAARLLVSSRPASPLLAAFRNNGLAFTEVNPTQPVAWFTPPTDLAETSSRKS